MPVPARDAATVMLLRDAVDEDRGTSVEVCMLRRNLAAEFSAGAYVFPGGSLDAEDGAPELLERCVGRGVDDADASLGTDGAGLALWVAALRECFEESGVLLAYRRGREGAAGPLLDLSEATTAERFAAHRAALNRGEAGLLDVCRQEDLLLAVDGVHYVSHWITPEVAPKRYDTRFFVAAAPPGQTAVHDEEETIASLWVRPSDALARHDAGEIELMPPTIANLKALGRFATTAEALTWAAAVTDVPTVLPVVLVDGGRLVVLRPGDPGYEEAAGPAGGPDDRAEAGAARGDTGAR